MTSELQSLIERLYPSRVFKDRDDQSRPLFLANTKAVATVVVERLSQCNGIEVGPWNEDDEATRAIQINTFRPSRRERDRIRNLPSSERLRLLRSQGGMYWHYMSIFISNVAPFYQYRFLGVKAPEFPGEGLRVIFKSVDASEDQVQLVELDNSPLPEFWKDIVDIAETALLSHNKRVLSTAEASEEVPWLDIRGSDLEEAGHTVVTVYDCFFGLS